MRRRRAATPAAAVLSPALGRPSLILHGYIIIAAAAATVLHVKDIRSILERLGEVTDVADDVVIALKGQRQNRLIW